jgi:TATA-box binding protein (TBP) (component of TFIID and TFIIIB)
MGVEITPYRISTMTATGTIGTSVDIQYFFENCEVDTENVLYMIYKTPKKRKDKVDDTDVTKGVLECKCERKYFSRGMHPTAKIGAIKRAFDNQVTCVIRLRENVFVNMKIFRNGNIQMTGVKETTDAQVALSQLVEAFKRTFPEDVDKFVASTPQIHLINSDFKVNYKLRRDILYQYIIDNNMSCSYEPDIYPGVKIQYFVNDTHTGQCVCEIHCGQKKKNLPCKKITIIVFQSGSIIITGAKSIDALNEAYNFTKSILTDNFDTFKKQSVDNLIKNRAKRTSEKQQRSDSEVTPV